MKITIAAIGKAKPSPELALYTEYTRRLSWAVQLKELEEKRPLPPDTLKSKEAELLLAATQGCDRLIALDEKGKLLGSEGFAAQIGAWRDQGLSHFAFVLGGSHGLSSGLLAKAHFTLSLSPMTWPHMMARAMLAEQLYRAETILTGHPYHRA